MNVKTSDFGYRYMAVPGFRHAFPWGFLFSVIPLNRLSGNIQNCFSPLKGRKSGGERY